MDIPDTQEELVDSAKKLAEIVSESELGKVLLEDVEEKAKDMLDDVRSKAEVFGLGDEVDAVVNKVEDATHIDVDGDGDTGE